MGWGSPQRRKISGGDMAKGLNSRNSVYFLPSIIVFFHFFLLYNFLVIFKPSINCLKCSSRHFLHF